MLLMVFFYDDLLTAAKSLIETVSLAAPDGQSQAPPERVCVFREPHQTWGADVY